MILDKLQIDYFLTGTNRTSKSARCLSLLSIGLILNRIDRANQRVN